MCWPKTSCYGEEREKTGPESMPRSLAAAAVFCRLPPSSAREEGTEQNGEKVAYLSQAHGSAFPHFLLGLDPLFKRSPFFALWHIWLVQVLALLSAPARPCLSVPCTLLCVGQLRAAPAPRQAGKSNPLIVTSKTNRARSCQVRRILPALLHPFRREAKLLRELAEGIEKSFSTKQEQQRGVGVITFKRAQRQTYFAIFLFIFSSPELGYPSVSFRQKLLDLYSTYSESSFYLTLY